MEVAFSSSFKRSFSRRIKGSVLEREFWLRLDIFVKDPFDSKLKTHKLSGRLKGTWSFSIEKNERVIFYFTKDKPPRAVFVDIGTHDEVY